MTITMHNARIPTIPEMTALANAGDHLSFTATNRQEAYAWIEHILTGTRYRNLRKKHRTHVRRYIRTMTGYSSAQLTRLISQWNTAGRLRIKDYRRHSFPRRYTDHDIVLLARVDEAHSCLAGPATSKILKDEYQLFHNPEYERLSRISPAHIYNLREKTLYRSSIRTYTKTQAVQRNIGERRKPDPSGKPGFLRVDSVHAGDSHDGDKGVYYINLVDEVLQWEMVLCVERLSERYLKPALQTALALLPFVVHNIHADNGSEYINQWVAELLDDLRVGLTKSRPRRSNDNALAETKNGSIVRKHLGYAHIAAHHAPRIHAWCLRYLNPYLNYHRPCGFPKEVIMNKHGKTKTVYPKEMYVTPYEKLKSLPKASRYLKTGLTFERLDKQAYAESHTAFAFQMNQAKYALLKTINP